MKSFYVSLFISIAAGLIFFGFPAFFSDSKKTKIIAFGIGVTIVFWLWLVYYINHKIPPLKQTEVQVTNSEDNPPKAQELKRQPNIIMRDCSLSNNRKDGIRAEGDITLDLENTKIEGNGENAISIIIPPNKKK